MAGCLINHAFTSEWEWSGKRNEWGWWGSSSICGQSSCDGEEFYTLEEDNCTDPRASMTKMATLTMMAMMKEDKVDAEDEVGVELDLENHYDKDDSILV